MSTRKGIVKKGTLGERNRAFVNSVSGMLVTRSTQQTVVEKLVAASRVYMSGRISESQFVACISMAALESTSRDDLVDFAETMIDVGKGWA